MIVGALAGFAGIGMAMRNGVRVAELDASLQTLRLNQDKIREFVSHRERRSKFRLDKLESLVMTRAEETRHMIDSVNEGLCGLNVDHPSSFLLNSKIMVNEIYSVLEGAQRGVIDPRMLPLATVQEMATPEGQLFDTVFRQHPGLFYTVATP